ncbi:hypothetical protein C1H46_005086 [Malus baccata]|uniref:Uncharacterized protein n=1 Tax=Malus baccata TaxID=106549 RepID=A0A540NDP5_MALBA|nr:hypothetical protein C1H46_005086 [Malus baccata]
MDGVNERLVDQTKDQQRRNLARAAHPRPRDLAGAHRASVVLESEWVDSLELRVLCGVYVPK